MMRIDPLTPALDSISTTVNVDWTVTPIWSFGGPTVGVEFNFTNGTIAPTAGGQTELTIGAGGSLGGTATFGSNNTSIEGNAVFNLGPMISLNKIGLGAVYSHDFLQGTDKLEIRIGPITVEIANQPDLKGTPKVDIPYGTQDLRNALSQLFNNPERATETGAQPVQYFQETQTFQQQLSQLPAAPDPQVQSVVAPAWETGAQPIQYLQETLDVQQILSGNTPADFGFGAQPGQYFQETQTFQEQLSGLPASPDPQVQSGDIVAPAWETGAQPVDFLQETLNFQQLSSGSAPAEQPMEQQGAIAGDTTAASAFLMTNESGVISFVSPNGTQAVDSTGFQSNGMNNAGAADNNNNNGGPTFNQIIQTFDQTNNNDNANNNNNNDNTNNTNNNTDTNTNTNTNTDTNTSPAPMDPYPTQVSSYPSYPSSAGGTGYPLVLDLSGKGIKITPLTSSNQFFNMTNDGYQHRTAWAGAGNGVLVLDLSNTGKIDSPRQFEFTAWDPTAKTDMQALKDVFDTNHDGKLDAGDADWASFKVMVTNPDGTTTLESLSQLGITSIDLTPNKNMIVLPDGSRIEGQTTFTKADGTTGAAADVALAFDPNGYATQQTKTVNADGSTSIDVKALNPDGSLANETISTTSADGLTKKLQYDHNGIGTFDQVQTDATVNNADGSQTETLSNFDVTGALTNKTITTTSADGKTVTIQRDLHGNGAIDQSEARVTNADGSRTVTLSDLAANGALKDKTVVTTSGNGLSKTVQIDRNGDGIFDLTQNDVTVVNADGSRTQTVTDLNSNGSVRDSNVTTTSADGRTKTITTDFNGDGVIDLTQVSSMVTNADGSVTTTQKDSNNNGLLKDETITTLSADGLSKTTQVDHAGSGTFDVTTTDVTVNNADGSKTETITDKNNNGSLRDQTVIVRGADGRSRTIQADTNGDGKLDLTETIAIAADGSSTDTVSKLDPDGTLAGKRVTTTSANGLTVTVTNDLTGKGTVDLTQSQVTVINPDHSSTVTATETNANGTLRDKTVVTTSANGMSKTTQMDHTGAGTFDLTHTDAVVLNADGSKTETVTDTNNNGSLRDKTVTTTSADRRTISAQTDPNGDGHILFTQTVVTNLDGSVVTTTSDLNADGSLRDKTVATTSATGLSTTTQMDTTGAGTFNLTRTDVTALNADGSRTETVTDSSANSALIDKTVITTSATGLSVTTQRDTTGAGTFNQTRTDVTALNTDGSRTETVSDSNANGSLKDKTVVTTSANGLSTTTQMDVAGTGTFNETRADAVVLNTDGSRTETVTDNNANGSLKDKTVTTVKADGITMSSTSDINGDGLTDRTVSTAVNLDGSKVTTVSDLNPNGTLKDKTVTTVSANGLSTTIQRDQTGAGTFDKTDTDVTVINADGSRTETVTCLKSDGSLVYKKVVTTSANGLSKTTQWDATGAGRFTLTETDVVVLGIDGSRIETITHLNADGSVKDQVVTTTSADRNTVTVTRDLNGSHSIDQIVKNLDGSTVRTVTDNNTNGTLRDKMVVTTSANGLSIKTQRDTTGAGTFNQTRTDVTVLNPDGSRTETVTDFKADGITVLDKIVTTTSANGLSTTTQYDLTGAGTFGETISNVTAVNADGSSTQTVTNTNGTGALVSRYVETISANHLSITKQWDTAGAGVFDQTATDVTVLNVDGSKTETVIARRADGSLMSQSVTTTSADGLTRTIKRDTTGSGTFDQTQTIVKVRNANGSSVETVTDFNVNGTVKDKAVTTTSADGLTVRVTRDINGDGVVDQTVTTVMGIDGSSVSTTTDFDVKGVVLDRTIVSTDPNGLSSTTQWDHTGTGKIDRTRTDVIVINLDGSRTETITDLNADGTLHQKGVLTTSADGRTKTLQKDTTGSGKFDHTETTTIAADGSSTTVMQDFNATGALVDQSTTTVSADGRTKTVLTDTKGVNFYDFKQVTQKNIDGTQVTNANHFNTTGTVKDRSVTTISADGLTKTTQTDSTNAGFFDNKTTVVTFIDGSTETTSTDLTSTGTTKDMTITDVSADRAAQTVWNYTGATNTLVSEDFNFSNGSSEADFFNPRTGVALEWFSYTGLNETGTVTQHGINPTAGGSQVQYFTGLAAGVTMETDTFTGPDATGTLTTIDYNYTNGHSEHDILNPQAGATLEFIGYSGLNETGTNTYKGFNWTAGGSQDVLFNPGTFSSQETENWTGAYGTGERTSASLQFTDGRRADAAFSYNASGTETGYLERMFNASGVQVWSGSFTPTGGYIAGTGSGGYAYFGYFGGGTPGTPGGGYDFASGANITGAPAGSDISLIAVHDTANDVALPETDPDETEHSAPTAHTSGHGDDAAKRNGNVMALMRGDGGKDGRSSAGINIGVIASFDVASGNLAAAHAAEAARLQAEQSAQASSSGQGGQVSANFEGAKWSGKTITWSLADSPGTAALPFSGYLSATYKPLIEKAFQEWAAASGLKFQEVEDSTSADIRIGWGKFDTATSGVIGYTGFQMNGGQFQPNTIIRLEDPHQDALATGTDGQLTYAGTQSELYQVVLHEIGHALGLADNPDPNSIMYYASGPSNRTLDNTDVAGIKALYDQTQASSTQASAGATMLPNGGMGSGAPSSAVGLNRLVQALATFDTRSSASSAMPHVDQAAMANAQTLATAVHLH